MNEKKSDLKEKLFNGIDTIYLNHVIRTEKSLPLLQNILKVIIGTNFNPSIENIFNAFRQSPIYARPCVIKSDSIIDINDLIKDKDITTIDFVKTLKESGKELSPKIIILGQDPYPHEGMADGMAFSCPKKQRSVEMIFKTLKRQKLIDELPKGSTLSAWAAQGILLLNTALTVEIGKRKSHVALWKDYIDVLIENLQEIEPNALWVMWGGEAQKFSHKIKNGFQFQWGHPSPENKANLIIDNPNNFLYNTNFMNINHHLVKLGCSGIYWSPEITHNVFITFEEDEKKETAWSAYFSAGPHKHSRLMSRFDSLEDPNFNIIRSISEVINYINKNTPSIKFNYINIYSDYVSMKKIIEEYLYNYSDEDLKKFPDIIQTDLNFMKEFIKNSLGLEYHYIEYSSEMNMTDVDTISEKYKNHHTFRIIHKLALLCLKNTLKKEITL